jgi:hypothetical protein
VDGRRVDQRQGGRPVATGFSGTPRPTTAPTECGTSTGCYSVDDDTLWGVNRRKKGAANTLAALRSIRVARPGCAPIYVILDNLSAHKGEQIRRWARKSRVEGVTPTPATRRPRRPTTRTRPHPQREGNPLGRTPSRCRSLTKPVNLCSQKH